MKTLNHIINQAVAKIIARFLPKTQLTREIKYLGDSFPVINGRFIF